MAVLLPIPYQQFTNPVTGAVLAFGKIYTYAAGTLTPKATFSDQPGAVPLTNPINLDAQGMPLSGVGGTRVHIWVDGSYKYIAQDQFGVTVDTADNVTSFVAGSTTIDIVGLVPNVAPALNDLIPTYDTSATANRKVLLSDLGVLLGAKLQQVSVSSSAVATGSTAIPQDDTIPQNTEGDQYLSQAITPMFSASTLVIEGMLQLSSSSASAFLVNALFQDTTANALKSGFSFQQAATAGSQVFIRHVMPAGTTSVTTFKLRGGAASGTTTLNGQSTGRLYGGTLGSYLTITEYAS